jgi:hypothetical protein
MKSSNYVLMSGNEPSDEQLSLLMKEVLIDVKSRAASADLKFQQILNQQIALVFNKYKK